MESLPADPNIMPRIEITPRLARAGRFLGSLLRFFPSDAPDFMSDHHHPRGAAELLDSYIAGDVLPEQANQSPIVSE